MRPLLFLIFLFALTLSSSGPAAADNLPTVRLLISNPAPYVGEEVIVTLEVRTTPRPQSAIIPIWPNLDSSASAELPTPPARLEEDQAVLVQIMQRAVRPLRSGRLPLSRAGVSIAGTTYHAQPVELRVLPLPERGRPDNFAGAIGQVTMQLQAEGRGSREIQIVLSGPAALETFPAPQAKVGANERLILLHDATVGIAPQERTRTLRYLYLPGGNDRGRLVFRLPVFDPLAHKYVVLNAGIEHIPTWLVHSALLFFTLLVLYLLVRSYRKSRTPRTVEEALERIIGRPPAQLCRDEIFEILRQHRADRQLLTSLASHWQSCDAQLFAPEALRAGELTAEEKRNSQRLLLQLIRITSWLRWLLTAMEKTIKDQLRARMAKLPF
ncbi:MAG: hypothetical protein IBX46_07340 [Desulfuromonadales bacterium]|nr:hypothetical protein [Desulfuromonadales bacterium]